MRLLLINHIQNANQSLRSRRIRSALTMTGVTIGVASITAILSLSGGASRIISDQINSLGGNIAVIRPGVATDFISKITQSQAQNSYATSTLTEDDITYIKNTPHVELIAPIMVLSGAIKAESTAPSDSLIVASTPDLAKISNLKISEGQFLDDSISQDTVVIGTQLSINIFGSELSIGRIMTIRNKPFTVVGVLSRTNNPINYNSVDFDNAAIISFAAGKELNNNVTQIQQINIKADSIGNLDTTIEAINKTLLTSHVGQNDFSVLTDDQISQPTSQLFYTIAGITTVVAAISLFVGGLGIMNIMLVTVTERTREIGIRKALGASNSDISWQFLIESLAIALGGGFTGYLFGYITAFTISNFLTFDPIINWQIAVTALVISLVMGTVFGLYPAIHAARKDPVESLHQYD